MDSTSALDSVLTQAELASMVMLDIDPAELAVDWPVNDAHVQQIIDSLPAHGNQIVFPPYVWLHKHLIIDGLHRVVAAYRAGIPSIRIILVDVSETRFWDLRIMAAKPHHQIESDRLYLWMETCWQSDWGKEGARTAIADNLWQLFRGENYRQNGSLFAKLDRSKLHGEQAELYDWFAAKSALWNIPVESLADRILALWNIKAPRPEIEQIAAKLNLPMPARIKLNEETSRSMASPKVVEGWAKSGMTTSLPDYRRSEKQQKQEAKVNRPAPRVETDQQVQRRKLSSVRDAIGRATDEIVRVKSLLAGVPESVTMLAKLMETIAELSQGAMEVDAVTKALADNTRLYSENADLKIKVASLERALGNSATVTADVIALSSSQIK